MNNHPELFGRGWQLFWHLEFEILSITLFCVLQFKSRVDLKIRRLEKICAEGEANVLVATSIEDLLNVCDRGSRSFGVANNLVTCSK
jgi:hypothetical protein